MKTVLAAVAATALALFVAPAALADSAGLVAAYGFEEASGTVAVDSSPAGNAGVFNGATRSASGRFGAAGSFDGVNDRIDIADSNSLDLSVGMTLEAWVRPTSLGWRTAILKERPGGLAYGLYASTDTNRPSAEIHAETRAPSAIATNVWTHLGTTYDGATLRLYVNGTQVSSRAVTGPITVSSNALRIGGNTVWGGEYFKGLIDEVRVYNRALTAGELQVDMNTAIVTSGGDTQAPTAPSVTATVQSGDDVHLSWSGATDNVGVTGYRVFRDGTLLTTLGAGTTSYDDLNRPNGTYRYTVVAVDNAGNASPASNEAAATVAVDTQAPTAPVLTLDLRGGDDVYLFWSGATDNVGVTGYRLFRNGTLLTTLGAGTTSYDDLDRPNGTHTYRVFAVDDAGNTSAGSNAAAATVDLDTQAPTAPTLTVTRTDNDMHLSWSGATDNSVITSYRVFRDGSLLTTLGPASAYDDINRPYGSYRYTVRAVDLAGNVGELSNEVVVDYDPDAGSPTAPVVTTSVVNGDDVKVKWSGATDDLGVKEYRVYRDGALLTTVTAPGDIHYDYNRPNGTYRYTVVAVDNGGRTSAASNEAAATVNVDSEPPTAPVVTGTSTGKDVHLTWTASTDNVDVTSYTVYRFIDHSEWLGDTSSAAREWTDRNLPDGTYRYNVGARDAAGNLTWSANVSVHVGPEDLEPPTAPVLTAVNEGGSWYLRWTPSTDDRGIREYSVWRNGSLHQFLPSPSITEMWLCCGSTGTWKVRATDTAGKVSAFSNEVTISAPDVSKPQLIIDPGCAGGARSDIVRIGGSVSDNSGANVTVRAEVDGTTIWAPSPFKGPFSFDWDTSAFADGPHTLKFTARDPSGNEAVISCTVTVDNLPSAPTGVEATVSDDDVQVTWDAVTGAGSYRVLRDGSEIATVTGTSYGDENRPNGTYEYTVVAVNSRGASDPSDAASVTVDADRTAPTVTLDAGCDGRTLSEYVSPITGNATDDRGGSVTTRVEVDGNTIWGPNPVNGAFSFNWDTRTVANGPHMMKVIARDAAGNETVKDCPWTVSNRALSVPITGVADGDTVSGTVALGFQPLADGQPVTAGVSLEIDGGGGTSRSSAPYTYSWDTTKVANGVHTIKAVMHWLDYPNPMATKTIQVTVNNAPPPPSGLVAAYGFEQTSGTMVTDSSGKGSSGTLSGATWAADGKFGRALAFDGVNDIVTVPDSSLLDLAPGMTLEAWVKPTTANGWRTVLLKERPGQLTYGLYATGDNGRPLVEVAAATQRDARGTAALPVGVWTHLAATYDKSMLRLYVNGTQVSSTAVTGTLVNSAGALKIGGNSVWGEYFSGLIDEVRVYERALSAAEIAADKDRAV